MIRIMTLIALVMLSLSGCSFIKPSGPAAHIHIQAAQFLNPNIHNQASPIMVTIYQLKNPYSFRQATYSTLAKNSADVLGRDLIDLSTIEVRPAEQKSIYQALSPNTQYLGIVAAYRQIDHATWRSTVKVVNAKGQQTTIQLNLESQALSTRTMNSSTSPLGIHL